MKKYLFIGLMAVLATSCEKDPDLSKLDNNFTVYTNYDSKTNFNDFKTYCLPDSILLIGQGMKAEFWKDENAQEIIKQVADEMDTRGYTRVKVIKNANIGLQLSFTRQTTQIIGTGGWYASLEMCIRDSGMEADGITAGGDPVIGDHIGTTGIIRIL